MKIAIVGRIVVGALVAAAAAVVVPRSPVGTVYAQSTAPQCMNTQVTLQIVRTSGAAGSIGEMFRIHNQAHRACTLRGFPGALLLDSRFHSLPTRVQRGFRNLAGRSALHTVTLQGSDAAYFILEWSHIPRPGQSCPTAPYIMIIPPNDRLPVVTYAGGYGGGIDACGGILTVSPVQGKPYNI